MRKFLSILLVSVSTAFVLGQSEGNLDVALGYSKNGGFNFGLDIKRLGGSNYGVYCHGRGITGIGNHSSGIDYRGILPSTQIQESAPDVGYWGIVSGALYSFPETPLTLGIGVGYGQKVTAYTYGYRHEFYPSVGTYSFHTVAEFKGSFTADILLDYQLIKRPNGIGLQVGFNTLHSAFGLLYYTF